MERLRPFLPKEPPPPVARYGIATAMVMASFLVMVGLRGLGGGPYGFFVLLPAVFVSSILFNKGTGYFAVTLEVIGLYLMLRTRGSFLPRGYIITILLFVVVALGLAWLSESLRRAWQDAIAAENAKDLLLQELGHRTKNNLAMVSSVLALQMRGVPDPEVRAALKNPLSRVHAISEAHQHVERGAAAEVTEMRDYLEGLCQQLTELLRGLRPIAIVPEIEDIKLPTARAVPVGLIVNELVTNALKYAFPDDSGGTVRVKLECARSLTLTVEDNGAGCEESPSGTGSRLVQLLVEQLQGSVARQSRNPGCAVIVHMPRD